MRSNLSVLFFKESAFCVLFKNSLSSPVVLSCEPSCWSWEDGAELLVLGRWRCFWLLQLGQACARHPTVHRQPRNKEWSGPDVSRLSWEPWLSRRPEHILTLASGSSQLWLQSVVLACILVGMRRIWEKPCLVYICAPFFYLKQNSVPSLLGALYGTYWHTKLKFWYLVN